MYLLCEQASHGPLQSRHMQPIDAVGERVDGQQIDVI